MRKDGKVLEGNFNRSEITDVLMLKKGLAKLLISVFLGTLMWLWGVTVLGLTIGLTLRIIDLVRPL